ncbi:hypothetical protein PINS_up000991 [Pythium insidiosum]|nr:hypothetical protein PINS_up000991 [Pythium insidiosum]
MENTKEKQLIEAAENGDARRVAALLDDGVDINTQEYDLFRRVALARAIESGNADIMHLLLDHGVDAEAKNECCGA